jgi:serine protease Do
MKNRNGKAAGFLVVALLGGIVGALGVRLLDRLAPTAGAALGAPVRAYTEVVDRGPANAGTDGVVAVVRQVAPAVINIDTVSRRAGGIGYPFSDEVREGQGSGFIINGRDGLAVTNNHVVEGAQQIRVTLADKRRFTADIVGTDPIGDIALIRIRKNEALPELKFGDSDRLEIGQTTIAIGNPLGFESTVTVGVLSQVGRQLEGSVRNIPLDDLLQTDAAINPGNSGGPLMDAQGRVIGMNTAIISRAQGLGFAVAANRIKRSVEDILARGRVVRPWIGVTMAELNPDVARELGIAPDQKGVAIAEARPNEPAAKAGLRVGDLIQEANGKPVSQGDELRRAIRELRPGQRLVLKGRRGAQAKEWSVVVGEMPPTDQLNR